MKTAILVHGCHLQAEGWEDMIWGNPAAGVLGRVPRALELLETEGAEFLFFGTGASEKDGLKESEYTFRHAVNHAHELPKFAGCSQEEIEKQLSELSHVDTETQNTSQEIEEAWRICNERGISRLILVSSPTHIPRCLLAAEELRADGKLEGASVFATASDVSYKGYGPADVVIAEPPHRGDRPKAPIHKAVKMANSLGRKPEIADEFTDALTVFAEKWKEELEKRKS